MSKASILRWLLVLAGVLLIIGGWYLGGLLTTPSVEGETSAGVQGDRTRITLAFRVKPEVVQARLPVPWKLSPPEGGPLQGANFFVVLVDRVRYDDPVGTSRADGMRPFVMFVAPAKHPRSGRIASLLLGGIAAPPDVPGFYQVYRAASVRLESTIRRDDRDVEVVTDVWEVREVDGPGEVAVRLKSWRDVRARTRVSGESYVLSAKDPAVRQRHRFEAAVDVVRSVPEGVDRVKTYALRLTVLDYAPLFDGSEQLVGISVNPWYVRQAFVP